MALSVSKCGFVSVRNTVSRKLKPRPPEMRPWVLKRSRPRANVAGLVIENNRKLHPRAAIESSHRLRPWIKPTDVPSGPARAVPKAEVVGRIIAPITGPPIIDLITDAIIVTNLKAVVEVASNVNAEKS
jgi:hypothetical protein